MKIVAYCALHYGSEYLEWAIRSVIDMVDEYHIFYTPHPSHGHTTKMTLPEGESKKVLFDIAMLFDSVVWHDVDKFWAEGDHRDYCVTYLDEMLGADLILWQDADEVWDADVLSDAYDQAFAGSARNYGVHAMHFWRGVNWVCMDACMPTRLIKPAGSGEAYISGQGFYHFGYAQSGMLVAYKSKIHGHRAEWRKNWWRDIYCDWKPGKSYQCGVHPTNECDSVTDKPFWTPVPFCRFDIEHLIGDHPYFDDDLI